MAPAPSGSSHAVVAGLVRARKSFVQARADATVGSRSCSTLTSRCGSRQPAYSRTTWAIGMVGRVGPVVARSATATLSVS